MAEPNSSTTLLPPLLKPVAFWSRGLVDVLPSSLSALVRGQSGARTGTATADRCVDPLGTRDPPPRSLAPLVGDLRPLVASGQAARLRGVHSCPIRAARNNGAQVLQALVEHPLPILRSKQGRSLGALPQLQDGRLERAVPPVRNHNSTGKGRAHILPGALELSV